MDITKNHTLGAIVTKDYRTAEVFEKYGLDFCCNGNRSLEEACNTLGIDTEQIITDIQKLPEGTQSTIDYDSWPVDLLADYIEKKHHRYVTEKIPIILNYLNKISEVHGDKHPELMEINTLFRSCAEELTKHMKREELILFPFIRKMVSTANPDDLKPPFGTVQNPVRSMMHEHDLEGERFRKIAALSNGYTPPADACNTYKVSYAMLKEFEDDLHLHIHLENNILFPKSIEMERQSQG